MKVRAKEVFIDKFTNEQYEVGRVLDLADEVRVKDLVDRDLVEIVEVPTKKPRAKKK